MRMLSPLRYALRWMANKMLPKYLEHANNSTYQKKLAIDKKIVVSFTSFPGRINTVWMVVECMLRQSIRPDSIILYLSREQFRNENDVPQSLLNRQNDIFKIKFVEKDYRSHKKYMYAFREFPNDIVITVDDDIFYPTTMIENLLKQYQKTPNAVVCRYGYKICYDENGHILPYNLWDESCDCIDKDFFGSGGGTLFNPKKLYKDVNCIELAMEMCPLADDIWLNAMVRLNNLQVVFITRQLILPVFSESKETLCSENKGQNKNDVQLKNVVNFYERNIGINPFKKLRK